MHRQAVPAASPWSPRRGDRAQAEAACSWAPHARLRGFHLWPVRRRHLRALVARGTAGLPGRRPARNRSARRVDASAWPPARHVVKFVHLFFARRIAVPGRAPPPPEVARVTSTSPCQRLPAIATIYPRVASRWTVLAVADVVAVVCGDPHRCGGRPGPVVPGAKAWTARRGCRRRALRRQVLLPGLIDNHRVSVPRRHPHADGADRPRPGASLTAATRRPRATPPYRAR